MTKVLISRAPLETRGCIIIAVMHKGDQEDRGSSRREPLPPVDPVELLGRLRVVLCVLSPDRKTHGVSPSNITSNHPLVSNVLPNLSPQLRLELQVSQRIVPTLRVRQGHRTIRTGF